MLGEDHRFISGAMLIAAAVLTVASVLTATGALTTHHHTHWIGATTVLWVAVGIFWLREAWKVQSS